MDTEELNTVRWIDPYYMKASRSNLPGTSLAHCRRIRGLISLSDQRFAPLTFLQVA